MGLEKLSFNYQLKDITLKVNEKVTPATLTIVLNNMAIVLNGEISIPMTDLPIILERKEG